MISNINYVKKVLGDLKAKKKFGQNFLIDENIVDKIAKVACDKDLKTIEQDTDRDNFMSSKQALEYGIIDEIIKKKNY